MSENVILMQPKEKPAKLPDKTMMQEIASWADAYRIPVDATSELCEIIESYMPDKT